MYLKRDEWNELKNILPKYLLDIIMVALLTGLRKTNVLNLRWEQIDLENKCIEILVQANKGVVYSCYE